MTLTKAAAIAATVALSVAVTAQGGPPGGGRQGGGMGMGRRMDPKQQADRMVQFYTQALNLTPAQQTKIRAIALKSAMDMKKIRDAQEAGIKKVLTADQQKKMASMRGPGGPGRGGGGAGGARRGGI